MIPVALEQTWRAHAADVARVARSAWWRVPIAVWRAHRLKLEDLPEDEQVRVSRKYLAELGHGVVPPLRRLRAEDSELETVDDPYLPAGLYERKSLHRWLWDRGWPRLSAIAWLWRNRAYGKAADYRYEHEARDVFLVRGDGDAGDEHDAANRPTRAGERVILAMRPVGDHAVAVAFERQRVGFFPAWLCMLIPPLKRRFWQVKEGWKLGDYADGSIPVQPTAAGLLQTRSLRPFQSRVGGQEDR